MSSGLPTICIFGNNNVSFEIPHCYQFENKQITCKQYPTDANIFSILATEKPDLIVSIGSISNFNWLAALPARFKAKWLHFNEYPTIQADANRKVADKLFECMLEVVKPIISVFTPAYKSGYKIQRPFQSLLSQTFQDWEWIIVDDSDDNKTFVELEALAKQDPRIRVYKASHSGNIGKLKNECCKLANGNILVELDHDDVLLPFALQRVKEAFEKHSDVGFIYTDFAEAFENGDKVEYGAGWGCGYGSYRDEIYNGILYKVCNAPNINAKTIRHIVAAPNHIRAWKKLVYEAIGGHSEAIGVADDYEVLVRTFLSTRILRIPECLYIQYRNSDGNTHQARNQVIQTNVKKFSKYYDKKIHERFLELGVNDFLWKEGESSFDRLFNVPNPKTESHCTITYDIRKIS